LVSLGCNAGDEELQRNNGEAAIVKRTVLVAMVVLLVVGFGMAQGKSKMLEVEGFDALIEHDGRFETTLVRPDADITRYTRLLPQNVEIELKKDERAGLRSQTGNVLGSKSGTVSRPSRKEVERLKQVIGEALVEELKERQPFEVVEEPGPGTLVLQCTFTDLIYFSPLKKSPVKDSDVRLVADGTIQFDFVDAESGVIQARVAERRRILYLEDPEAKKTDPEKVWADVGEWAHRVVTDLCDEIVRMQAESEDGADTASS
jgi:hypothetical protein